MDYGKLLSRALTIVWEQKYLIVLGVLAALGSGGNGQGGVSYQMDSSDTGFQFPNGFEWGQGWPGAISLMAILFIIILFIIIALAVWMISLVARGGLIAGVDTIETGRTSSFARAWQAAWPKVWTLMGIGILPLIPLLLVLVSGVFLFVVTSGASGLMGLDLDAMMTRTFITFGLAAACLVLPITLVLVLLQTFANRACILEDRGVLDSYGRGWAVLTQNFGPALVLFILQIIISIGLGIVMFVPGFIMALCFLLWPILLLIQGAIAAYFSTMWTLAWREWTGTAMAPGAMEDAPLAA